MGVFDDFADFMRDPAGAVADALPGDNPALEWMSEATGSDEVQDPKDFQAYLERGVNTAASMYPGAFIINPILYHSGVTDGKPVGEFINEGGMFGPSMDDIFGFFGDSSGAEWGGGGETVPDGGNGSAPVEDTTDEQASNGQSGSRPQRTGQPAEQLVRCKPLSCYERCKMADKERTRQCRELNRQYEQQMKAIGCEGTRCSTKAQGKTCR